MPNVCSSGTCSEEKEEISHLKFVVKDGSTDDSLKFGNSQYGLTGERLF